MTHQNTVELKNAMIETASKPAPINRQLKIDALKKQQEAIRAKIAEIESRDNAQKRKEDTRLKVIIGAAVLANTALHPETREGVVELLEKAITAPRDREFLKGKGWLQS